MALVFTNHFREKIGVSYGSPIVRPGGKAKDHATAVAIDMLSPEFVYAKVPGALKADGTSGKDISGKPEGDAKLRVEPIGLVITGEVKKSNVGPSAVRFEVEVRWMNGRLIVNRAGELADWGRKLGLITRKDGTPMGGGNAIGYFDGEEIAKGQLAVEAAIREQVDLRDRLEERIRTAIRERKTIIVQNGSDGEG